MLKRGVLIVLAVSACGLWLMAKADPRLTYSEECDVPFVSSMEASVRTNLALSQVEQLLQNAPSIYGPYNRAEQRLIELALFFGAPYTDNSAYRFRIRAAFTELSLIWDLAMAKGLSPCSTQHLVPDHRADNVEAATAKLRSLAASLR